jgi:hypothetical protein
MTLGNGSDQAAMEYGLRYNPPMDPAVGERNLKETKQILDQMGVVFLLQSGSCLGLIRDKAFIPWDDDIDLASVMGMNGLTEEKVDAVMAVFRDAGYYCKVNYSSLDAPPYAMSHSIIKDHGRVDWSCMKVVDSIIHSYPGVQVPAALFTNPKEIEFLGENFFVPNPPEEYLKLKYGPEWFIPKKAGDYEKDIVARIPSIAFVGRSSRLKVLDHDARAVTGAEVVLVGGATTFTDESGYAEVILPVTKGLGYYALIIRYPGHEQVLYEEEMEPDKTYVYSADSFSKKAESALGVFGTLGNLLLPE